MATPNAAARSRYSARRRTMVNQSPAMGLLHLEGDITRDRMRVRGDGTPFDAIVTGLERLCRRDDHGLAVAGSRDAGVDLHRAMARHSRHASHDKARGGELRHQRLGELQFDGGWRRNLRLVG